LSLLILVAREGFLKDKCGPRTKKFEHHCAAVKRQVMQWPVKIKKSCSSFSGKSDGSRLS